MIRLSDVHKDYAGGVVALKGIDLEIGQGEFLFITGSSGAGKSTLLRLLLRQEAPSRGEILVNGRNVGSLPPSRVPELRRSIGVVFQDFKLISRKTALENVAYVLNVAGQDPRQGGQTMVQPHASQRVVGPPALLGAGMSGDG